ncbi:CoA ester lyase [uncultured Paraglaciecola sp.]|uniref:HpcH/HpaI aldolase/citrate lyase family protein n=1 Tax=uncultured Paraglaciecola sp. TaxID=1765024 RepID=UPI0030DA33E4|tara:strand:- start:11470 stop:12345 length:876 start_codon:yes stop_codon:yes gene_type:complete
MRSKLFVPGIRPELFNKALAGPADAISIDLEDSVVASKKAQARDIISEFLLSEAVSTCLKTIIVRCNGIYTRYFKDDLAAVIRPNLSMLNLPKIESAKDVLSAVSLIEKIEQENAIVSPIPLLVNIETATGLRNVTEICAAHKRVAGLQLGLNDLFDSAGIDRDDKASVHSIMLTLRLAACEAGIKVYDGAFPDINNMQGFHAEVEMARRLGYSGKSCIHPNQVAIVNRLFIPAAEDVALAAQIVEAAEKAEIEGIGVFTVAGKMIDLPSIQRAKSVLAEYKRYINPQTTA